MTKNFPKIQLKKVVILQKFTDVKISFGFDMIFNTAVAAKSE